MVKEAVESLGGKTSNIAVRDWILKKYPGVKDKPLRGLIIAQHISDRIRYALADVPDVSAVEYKLNITFMGVAHVDSDKQ